MIRLAMVIYVFIATTLMGIFVVAVLTVGRDTGVPIIAAAAIGAVLALPVTWFVARAIVQQTQGHGT